MGSGKLEPSADRVAALSRRLPSGKRFGGEESPSSTGRGCWVTPRRGDPTDSATETYRPGPGEGIRLTLNRQGVRSKGEMVR